MGRYRLKEKVGNHAEGDKTYESGDIVESARDLAKKHPNKFEKVHEIPASPQHDVPLAAPKKTKTQPEDVEDVDVSTIESRLGTNVTDDFPLAVDANIAVFQKGKKFRAADPDLPDRALTGKGLTKEAMVLWLEENAE